MFCSKPRSGYEKILYEQHLERVQNMKKTIDNNEPKKRYFVNKYKIENENNQIRIELENKQLCERLAYRMQKSSLDNQPSKSYLLHSLFMKKISHDRKLTENMVIQKQNNKLLEHIQTIKPTYDFAKFEQYENIRKQKMEQMLLYPELYKKRQLHKASLPVKKCIIFPNTMKDSTE